MQCIVELRTGNEARARLLRGKMKFHERAKHRFALVFRYKIVASVDGYMVEHDVGRDVEVPHRLALRKRYSHRAEVPVYFLRRACGSARSMKRATSNRAPLVVRVYDLQADPSDSCVAEHSFLIAC